MPTQPTALRRAPAAPAPTPTFSETELARRLTPAIRLFAARAIRPVEAQPEFVHDVLLQLLEAARGGKVDGGTNVSRYALAICRNVAMNHHRRRRRRSALWERYADPEEPSTDGGLSLLYPRADVEDCLSQLTQRARQVLRRAIVLGETAGEVGAALQVSEANVRVIRHRALGQMRECLEGTPGEDVR